MKTAYSLSNETPDGTIFFAGIIPDLDDKKEVKSPGNIEEQMDQVFNEFERRMELDKVGKVNIVMATVIISSMDLFPVVNARYAKFFEGVEKMPARALFSGGLVGGSMLEIVPIASRHKMK